MADPKAPPSGSFPGFSLGTELFSTWTDSMLQQARTWNTLWGRMRAGTHEAKDWYKAMGESIDVAAASVERLIQGVTGPAAPPWVTLPWPPRNEVPVRIRCPIAPNDPLRATPLYLVGAPVDARYPLEVGVRTVSSYELAVWTDPNAKAVPGEYMGFIFGGKSSGPLAVTHMTVLP